MLPLCIVCQSLFQSVSCVRLFVSLPPRLQWVLSSLPKERTCISAYCFMCGSMCCLDAYIWSPVETDNVLFSLNKDNKSQSVRRLCMTSCGKGKVSQSVQLSICQRNCIQTTVTGCFIVILYTLVHLQYVSYIHICQTLIIS